jgi:hypothetical protein
MDTPKPQASFISLAFLLTGALMITYGGKPGWWLAGSLSFLIAIGCAWWIPAAIFKYARIDELDAEERWMKAYTLADPTTRDVFGLHFPRLRVKVSEQAWQVTVDYSGVQLRYFQQFMEDSNPDFISAERHWPDKSIARKQWYLWQKYLMNEKAIIAERQGQNETWRWRTPKEYRLYMAYVTLSIPRELIAQPEQPPEGTQPLPEIPTKSTIRYHFDA